MSDSYRNESVSRNHWEKLADYLIFRRASEGVWINESPDFWFNVITNTNRLIIMNRFYDSGGGPLDAITLEIYPAHLFAEISILDMNAKEARRIKNDRLFRCYLKYDDVFSHPTFIKRAKEVYDYMGNYSREEDTWFGKACDVCDTEVLGGERWDMFFGPLKNVPKLEDRELKRFPFKGFEFLGNLYDSEVKLDEISVSGEIGKEIDLCKKWALFAMLEMNRFYWTSC